MSKTNKITIRLTDKELEFVKTESEKKNKTIADYCRKKILIEYIINNLIERDKQITLIQIDFFKKQKNKVRLTKEFNYIKTPKKILKIMRDNFKLWGYCFNNTFDIDLLIIDNKSIAKMRNLEVLKVIDENLKGKERMQFRNWLRYLQQESIDNTRIINTKENEILSKGFRKFESDYHKL